MTPKQFRNFYLSFCNLYGCLDSDAALEIINIFFPKVTKEQLFADLKSRIGKTTKGYQVIETTDNDYIIAKEYYDFAGLDMLFEKQGTCPFYVPDDLQTYWAYGDEFFMEDMSCLNDMMKFFEQFYKEEEQQKQLLLSFYVRMGIQDGADPESILTFLEKQEGLSFTVKQMKEFENRFYDLRENTRLVFYRGHTPSEMAKISKGEMETDENVGLC